MIYCIAQYNIYISFTVMQTNNPESNLQEN